MAKETPVLDGLGNLLSLPANIGYKLFVEPGLNLFGKPFGGGKIPETPGSTASDQTFRDQAINLFLNDPSKMAMLKPQERMYLESILKDPNAPKAEVLSLLNDVEQRGEEMNARDRTLSEMDKTRGEYTGFLQGQADDLQKMISSGDYLTNETYNQAFQATTDAAAKNAARAQSGASRSAAAGGFRDAGFLSTRVGQARDAANIAAGQTMSGIRMDAGQRKTAIDKEIADTNKSYGDYRTEVLSNPNWRGVSLPDFTGYGVGNRNQVIGANQLGLGTMTTGFNTAVGNLFNLGQLGMQGSQQIMGLVGNRFMR